MVVLKNKDVGSQKRPAWGLVVGKSPDRGQWGQGPAIHRQVKITRVECVTRRSPQKSGSTKKTEEWYTPGHKLGDCRR